MTIKVWEGWTVERGRNGDRAIMDEVIRLGASRQECRMVNKCRMYLRVLTVADVVMVDGEWLEEEVMRGELIESSLGWPEQGKPGRKAWGEWRRWMRKVVEGKK